MYFIITNRKTIKNSTEKKLRILLKNIQYENTILINAVFYSLLLLFPITFIVDYLYL